MCPCMHTFLALSMNELKEIGIEPFAVRKKLHMAIQGEPVKYREAPMCACTLPISLSLPSDTLAEAGAGGGGHVMGGEIPA